jgi:hypothetical protein
MPLEAEIKASSFTYEAAAKALGWRSDRRLRNDKRKGLLHVQFLGYRTAQIKRQELVRYAREYGLVLYL